MSGRRGDEPALPALRAEEEALLLAARAGRDPAAAARLAALFEGPLDGAELVQLALEHGMLPLVQRNLRALDRVPAAVEGLLADNARRCAWRSLQLAGELVELLDLFAAHGISALPYKGPVLAASAYGGVERRQFGDLDLLLERCAVPRAKELLIDRGFHPEHRFDAAQEQAHLAHGYVYCFVKEEGKLRIELHWRVLPRRFRLDLDFAGLWRRAGTATLAGREVPALALEDHFILICVHAAKHRWELLLWLCDAAELLERRRDQVDWRSVALRARRWGAERRVLVTLILARELLAARVPEPLAERIAADPAARRAAESVGPIVPRAPVPPMRHGIDRQQLQLMERLRHRLHFLRPYLLRRLRPTARDRAWLPLPERLRFLHVLLRPLRVLVDHGLRPYRYLLRALRGS